jgi:hypothetical protein
VGLGTGNKDQMLGHLMMILQEQKQAIAIGLTRPDLIYNTLAKLTQNAGFKMADEFWSDPRRFDPPPQPPSPEQIKAQTEIQKVQMQAQEEQMKFQAQSVIEQQKMQMQLEMDRNRQEMEARQKQLEMQQAAELEAYKMKLQEEAELKRMDFEKWKAELDANVKLAIAQVGNPQQEPDARIDQLLTMAQDLTDQMNSPAEIVRDETGKAIGVRRGKSTKLIQRGPDGRPTGLQ